MDTTGDVLALDALIPGEPSDLDGWAVIDGDGNAASAFDVDRALAASATFAASGLAAIGDAPGGGIIDLDHVRSFCTTHVEVDGRPVPGWAPLSGVYECADGRHLQVHCNFPHHADAVTRTLGTGDDPDAVAAAMRERRAFELEDELAAAGAIAAVVRDLDEWNAHPHAAATSSLPVIDVTQIGAAPAAHAGRVRVLDCSRVLAGPVAGQLLAASGADVLRLGAAHLPSVDVGVISTGFGKRNAHADLRTSQGRTAMEALLAGAEVWIDAYRPGALATFGLTPERAADLRPGIVVVQISAYDWVGPWAGRRGFDSIVQSTTGVRWAGGAFAVDGAGRPVDVGPTGLPVQALDYATGFLAAGAAAQLVAHQRRAGGSWLVRLSLLRTRNWLVGMGGPAPYVPQPVIARPDHVRTLDTEFGRVTAVTPFVGEWTGPPRRLGSVQPIW